MKISASTLGCPDWPLTTICQKLPGYGYDAVDFRGVGPELCIWKLPEFSSDADATRQRIAEAGLLVSCFSSGALMFNADPEARPGDLDEVTEYTKLCAAFDTPLIRVFGGKLGGADWAEAMQVAVDMLRRMSDIAGESVIIGVETHDDWVASAPLADAVSQADRPNIGVVWDLHHPFQLAGEDPQTTYDNIGAMTVGVHVKDSRTTDDGGRESVLPGEGGEVPLAELVGLLAAGGYDGYLTCEYEKRWRADLAAPEVSLPAYAELMKQLG